jgi:S1-C subfamily serine protease
MKPDSLGVTIIAQKVRLYAAVVLFVAAHSSIAAEAFDDSILDGPSFGFNVVPADQFAKIDPYVAGRSGLVVGSITEGSAIHVAGVPWMALMVAIDGWEVKSIEGGRAALKRLNAGDEISITYYAAELNNSEWRLA